MKSAVKISSGKRWCKNCEYIQPVYGGARCSLFQAETPFYADDDDYTGPEWDWGSLRALECLAAEGRGEVLRIGATDGP